MARKLTQDEYIDICKRVHNNKYDYSKTVYINKRTKITITCPIHGDFQQYAQNHKKGQGCPICGEEKAREQLIKYYKLHPKGFKPSLKKIDKFLRRVQTKFKNQYEYPNLEQEFVNNNSIITIAHKVCGNSFRKKAKDHMATKYGGCSCLRKTNESSIVNEYRKHKLWTIEDFKKSFDKINEQLSKQYECNFGEFKNLSIPITFHCNKCGKTFKRKPTVFVYMNKTCPHCNGLARNRAYTTEEWIGLANKIHNNKYDYSKAEYIKTDTKLCVICHQKDEFGDEHGEFWVTPHSHTGSMHTGCPKCSQKYSDGNRFSKLAALKHNNFYDYSLVKYKNAYTKVEIICPEHGVFTVSPNQHLMGKGCPLCCFSALEKAIKAILDNLGIEYIYQAKKRTLKWLDNLSLDFYLPKYNVGIECQGEQHYKFVKFFHHTEERFKLAQERDNKKSKLCEENYCKLLYYSDIEEVVDNEKIFDLENIKKMLNDLKNEK